MRHHTYILIIISKKIPNTSSVVWTIFVSLFTKNKLKKILQCQIKEMRVHFVAGLLCLLGARDESGMFLVLSCLGIPTRNWPCLSYETNLRAGERMREQFNQEEHVEDQSGKIKKDAASSIRPWDIKGAEML